MNSILWLERSSTISTAWITASVLTSVSCFDIYLLRAFASISSPLWASVTRMERTSHLSASRVCGWVYLLSHTRGNSHQLLWFPLKYHELNLFLIQYLRDRKEKKKAWDVKWYSSSRPLVTAIKMSGSSGQGDASLANRLAKIVLTM